MQRDALAFNYMTGMYSNSSPNFLSGNIETHGAHVQYNLLEGNVVSKIDFENIWGSNADNTLFRNWVTGADIACNPYNAMAPPRQTVVCTPMGEQGSAGVNGWWEIQFVTAVNSSFLSTYQNFVGDVIGSAAQAALNQYNNPSSPMGHTPVTNAPSVRSYDAVAYGFALGFGEASDTGGVPIANGVGCDGSYLSLRIDLARKHSVLLPGIQQHQRINSLLRQLRDLSASILLFEREAFLVGIVALAGDRSS